MSEDENKSIKNNVVKAIAEGRVTMKPRWQFLLNTILFFCGSLLAALVILYLVSFLMYVGGEAHGLNEVLSTLPWIVLGLAVVFILILEVLLRHYSFAYRKPLLYTLIGIIIMVLLTGFIISQTSLHSFLSEQEHKVDSPFGGGFYKRFDPHYNDNDDDDNLFPSIEFYLKKDFRS